MMSHIPANLKLLEGSPGSSVPGPCPKCGSNVDASFEPDGTSHCYWCHSYYNPPPPLICEEIFPL